MDQENPERGRSQGAALDQGNVSYVGWTAALIVTLLVRLYLFQNYYTINNDGVLYIEAARHFWEGRWAAALASFYPPLFPLMIAAAYPLTGDWELAGQFWPFVLGVLTLFPLFGLLQRIYGARAARIALFFYGVSPYLARLSLHVRSEIPYVFFLVAALYFLQKGMDQRRWQMFFPAGVSAALAYLIRSEGFGIIIVAALFLLWRAWAPGDRQGPGLQLACLFLGFMLAAAPYILYLRWDTGRWLISRKAGLIVSLSLAEYDATSDQVGMKESDRVSVIDMIASRPLVYGKKVFVDAFRSLGVYFEALHYSYLPFFALAWLCYFPGRFREQRDFLPILFVVFYLAAFALLYVNRRYAVTLVPVSLGWVALGYLAVAEYFLTRWEKRGRVWIALIVLFFLIGTLPKTLQAIGRDKFYLRQGGAYLKGKPGNPTVLTANGRVGFYAEGRNHVIVSELSHLPGLLAKPQGDYLAVEAETLHGIEGLLGRNGWLLDKEFSQGDKEKLVIFRRAGRP